MRGLIAVAVQQYRFAEQADRALEFHASGFQGQGFMTKCGATTRRCLVWLMLGLTLAIPCVRPRVAQSATTPGSIIANIASATYTNIYQVGFTVGYNATRLLWVTEGPQVTMWKAANPTLQVVGGTVTFTLWITNSSSSMSTFNIMVTDILPQNMAFTGLEPYWPGSGGVSWSVTEYRSSTGPASAPRGDPAYSIGTPAVGQESDYYLRWVIDMMGPGQSGFVRWTASIL